MEKLARIRARYFRARSGSDGLAWLVFPDFPALNPKSTIKTPLSRPAILSVFPAAGPIFGAGFGAVDPNQRIERALRLGIAFQLSRDDDIPVHVLADAARQAITDAIEEQI